MAVKGMDNGFPPDLENLDEAEMNQKPQKERLVDVFFNSLPTALSNLVVKSLLMMALFVVMAVVVLVVTGIAQVSFLFALALWCGWNAVSILMDYRDGNIIERTLVCTSAVPYLFGLSETMGGRLLGKAFSSKVKVTFRDTNEESPSYYQYIVPGAKRTFYPAMVYVTYVRRNNPQVLMAYLAL